MRRVSLLAAFAVFCLCQSAMAVVMINEIYFSPEDPKDDRQFFELISDTGGVESLDGLWLLEIEGDLALGGVLDNPGQVLNAFNLNGFSTGTNGLFLWRDSSTVLDNSPAPGIQGPGDSGLQTQAFSPQIFGFDLEDSMTGNDLFINDVHTFLLVENYTGLVPTSSQEDGPNGPDLDVDDNGVLEITPWDSVIDGVSSTEFVTDDDDEIVVDGDGNPIIPGFQYAGQFGGLDHIGGFGADVWHRLIEPGDNGAWAFFDSSSGDGEDAGFQGPFFANDSGDAAFEDGTEIVVGNNSMFLYATPGAANLTGVPEPATIVLLGAVAGVGLLCRRRF